MDKDNKLNEVANEYMNVAKKLITFNGKRNRALSNIMTDSFFGICLPGNNFEKVPEELVQAFNILIKWKKKIDKKLEEQRMIIDKKYFDIEMKNHEFNKNNYEKIVSSLHMSNNMYEVLDNILLIAVELHRLKYLTKAEKDNVQFVKI